MKFYTAILLALILSGCASGIVVELPTTDSGVSGAPTEQVTSEGSQALCSQSISKSGNFSAFICTGGIAMGVSQALVYTGSNPFVELGIDKVLDEFGATAGLGTQ